MMKSVKLNLIKFVALCSISTVTAGTYAKTTTDNEPITVEMMAAEGQNASGEITFTQKKNYVLIVGKLTGLTPGKHGFHIHTSGDCSDLTHGFETAGGHFNPTNMKHGSMKNGHIGDLGNIKVSAKGEANFKIKVKKFNLEEGDEFSILGRSVMVHANPDDEKTNPAGNSGDRILCGTIQ